MSHLANHDELRALWLRALDDARTQTPLQAGDVVEDLRNGPNWNGTFDQGKVLSVAQEGVCVAWIGIPTPDARVDPRHLRRVVAPEPRRLTVQSPPSPPPSLRLVDRR